MLDETTSADEQAIDLREIGATGLKRFSGFVFEEFLQELVGWRGTAVFKEMGSNDATVTGMLFAIRMLCRKVPWRTKAASQDPADQEAADFLKTCMDDMSHTWTDTIDEILSMLQYGFSPHEIVYKRRAGDGPDASMRSKYADGRIGWRKLPIRSQDTIYRWLFDQNGGIQGVEQQAPPDYTLRTIPIEKMLLFRTTVAKNNPEGQSILRGAYRSWYMKKNIENIEAIGIERDLAGLPMAMVPPEIMGKNATADQKAIYQAIKEIVVNVRRDQQEGIVLPMSYDATGKLRYDFKLLSTGGARQFDTNQIISRYDSRIALTCMADFLLIGHQAVGSYALVDSKRGLFATAIGAYLDIIAEVFNRYAIPRLFKLNDFNISAYPTIEHADTDNVDLETLGKFLQSLSAAGMPIFPNPELEKYLYKVAKVPEPEVSVAPTAAPIQSGTAPAQVQVGSEQTQNAPAAASASDPSGDLANQALGGK